LVRLDRAVFILYISTDKHKGEKMNTKLTIKLDKGVIEKAKDYVKKEKTSLSKMIENYLLNLTSKKPDFEITPLVKSLSGVIKPVDDYKKDYTDYLTEKYK
jgi:hypothetical protein